MKLTNSGRRVSDSMKYIKTVLGLTLFVWLAFSGCVKEENNLFKETETVKYITAIGNYGNSSENFPSRNIFDRSKIAEIFKVLGNTELIPAEEATDNTNNDGEFCQIVITSFKESGTSEIIIISTKGKDTLGQLTVSTGIGNIAEGEAIQRKTDYYTYNLDSNLSANIRDIIDPENPVTANVSVSRPIDLDEDAFVSCTVINGVDKAIYDGEKLKSIVERLNTFESAMEDSFTSTESSAGMEPHLVLLSKDGEELEVLVSESGLIVINPDSKGDFEHTVYLTPNENYFADTWNDVF